MPAVRRAPSGAPDPSAAGAPAPRADVLPLERNLSYRIARLNAAMARATASIYGREGLTTHQWKVISVLYFSAPLSATGILQLVSLDKAAVSRVVKQLLKLGLVTRRLHDLDGRVLHLILTDAARAAYERMATDMAALQTRLLADVPADQARALFPLLDRIETGLAADDEDVVEHASSSIGR